jgi:hypothetical protein
LYYSGPERGRWYMHKPTALRLCPISVHFLEGHRVLRTVKVREKCNLPYIILLNKVLKLPPRTARSLKKIILM